MFIVRKKAWPEFFEKVLKGEKKFDLRLGDFNINEGDVLVLEEWDPKTKEYTGRKIEKKVKSLMRTKNLDFWTKEEIDEFGLVVISFD